MRIDKLSIPAYHNLRDFEIEFDKEQSTTVLLGRNGSGKSNLIEAIVEIFSYLERGLPPSFAYVIHYNCREREIVIDADPARPTKRLIITVDGTPVTLTAFKSGLASYLPTYIFAYYSGWSSRLEDCFDEPTRRYYYEVLNSPQSEMPFRRLFFCRKEYSQLVLLAFFLSKTTGARQLLETYLNIKHFDSALFVLKKPWWGGSKGTKDKTRSSEGDSRFWYARGAFTTFMDRLWDRALAPIRHTEPVERDIRKQGENTEHLYLFIKNEAELARLKDSQGDAKSLFGYLESLFLCDLIDEVRVTVERTDGTRIKFTQLSEGEQQLLTVLGLLIFSQNDESLYLLDEPDTHLNPTWIYDFLKLLQDNIRTERGQLIVATHDPLMIGTLHKNQVRSLTQVDNLTQATEPEYDPMGIGVEGLLKSELYGLRSTLAPEVLKKLDRHYVLLGNPHRSDAEQIELIQLAQELNELGVSRTHPNPYFELFANAMAKRAPELRTSLTKAEIEEQTKLADEVLAEIIAEEESPKASQK